MLMDRRALIAGAVGLGLGGTASAQTRQPQGSSPTLHDLMPGFWRVYDALPPKAPAPQKASAISTQFYQPNQAVYAAVRLGPVDIGKWLGGFDPQAPQVHQLDDAFTGAWAAHRRRFARALPDADASLPAYKLISFGQFSSRPSRLDGRPALVFGIDTVAQQQGADFDLGVLMDHDAFQLYQQQVNPAFARSAGGTLWGRLWREGLAEYASEQLNPGASRYDVLLDDGHLADASPGLVSSVASEVLNDLDTADPLEHSRLFDMGGQDELPPRMGFLIGLTVAERIGKGRSLADLARLPAARVRALMQSELSTLAHG